MTERLVFDVIRLTNFRRQNGAEPANAGPIQLLRAGSSVRVTVGASWWLCRNGDILRRSAWSNAASHDRPTGHCARRAACAALSGARLRTRPT
jgi:hypothetical protein